MKAFFLVLISFISIGINAQRYSNKYGVENLNDINNEQLMYEYSKANSASAYGKLILAPGIACLVVSAGRGLSRGVKSMGEIGKTIITAGYYKPNYPEPKHTLTIVGAALTLVGTVTVIATGSRLRKLMPVIKSRGLVSNISVQPGAGYNLLADSYYPAMTVKIKF